MVSCVFLFSRFVLIRHDFLGSIFPLTARLLASSRDTDSRECVKKQLGFCSQFFVWFARSNVLFLGWAERTPIGEPTILLYPVSLWVVKFTLKMCVLLLLSPLAV